MKVFQRLQKQYAILGVTLSNQELPLNAVRLSFGFLSFVYIYISKFIYTLHVANGFLEYLNCACSMCANLIVFVCFATIISKRTLLFQCIENAEKLFDSSKL